MPVSHFASRLRKDLSTEMIRTNIAHRKSLSQKENRHKVYERNRCFGLKDVNIPLEGKDLVNILETSQDHAPEKASTKTKAVKVVLSDQRKQLLQKYKEEKQLQKLKEQREKAKRGVFKVGLYRPAAPGFLTTDQRSVRAEPEKAFPYSGRITRSKVRVHMEQTKVDNKTVPQATQSGHRQPPEKKIMDKEKKAVQPMVSTSWKVTGSGATQRTKTIARTVPSTIRKPVTRAASETGSERTGPSRGRPAKKEDAKPGKVESSIGLVISSKVESEDSQTSVANEMDPGGLFQAMESLPKTAPAKVKERNSFAPKHCVFQPPCGLKTYRVTPMSPRSANAFLIPTCDWNLLKPEVTTTQDTANEISVQQKLNKSRSALDSLTDCNEERGLHHKTAPTSDSNPLSVREVTAPGGGEGQTAQPQHDVLYFRQILQSETDTLTSHCLEWERKLGLDIPDDAKDLIRTAIGQTRLLIKERFKQFEGLVDNCEYKRGEKETTCTDLDGFWDMVGFQVEDVKQKFNNLTKLEESGWKDRDPSTMLPRKKIVPGRTSKAKQDDDGRKAARNRLAAIKNAMRERLRQEERAPVATAETPKEVDKIVFDAGFFRIESPVKSFSGLSSERRSQRFGTLASASRDVPETRAAGNLLRQTMSLQKPDPQSSDSERADETLLSTILESRCSRVEGAPHSREQDSSDVDYDGSKVTAGVDLPLPAGGLAGDVYTDQKEAVPGVEGVGLHPKVTCQDVVMSDLDKTSPSHRNSSAAADAPQSVLFHRNLTSECPPLNLPGLSCTSPFVQEETRPKDRARLFSFGGDLIVFSPLRPQRKEHQEDF
ncbi:disks large-associated protein 5 [Acomys russatus]|uniref:disks large-associated protein 5 n=1 Tax=Acomys russatus TaxID=60746 RepID=UPI0021E20E70|nr:disks large-associated protein 5 [Acomys russatus]